MQLAGNDYRCILICMFACWKKFCYAALTAKTFANFAPFLDPKMEVEKWTQKWCQNLTPKMGSKNGTQKGCPIFFWIYKKSKLYLKYWVSLLGAIFGPHFGGQILAPFLGPFFNLHFGVQKWCKFCKSFCQSCIAKLFPASKHAYQNASVVISQLIASFNTIQSSTWSSLPEKQQILIATYVAHKQIEPQNLILWRSLHATPVFYMKNDPRFGGRQS